MTEKIPIPKKYNSLLIGGRDIVSPASAPKRDKGMCPTQCGSVWETFLQRRSLSKQNSGFILYKPTWRNHFYIEPPDSILT